MDDPPKSSSHDRSAPPPPPEPNCAEGSGDPSTPADLPSPLPLLSIRPLHQSRRRSVARPDLESQRSHLQTLQTSAGAPSCPSEPPSLPSSQPHSQPLPRTLPQSQPIGPPPPHIGWFASGTPPPAVPRPPAYSSHPVCRSRSARSSPCHLTLPVTPVAHAPACTQFHHRIHKSTYLPCKVEPRTVILLTGRPKRPKRHPAINL